MPESGRAPTDRAREKLFSRRGWRLLLAAALQPTLVALQTAWNTLKSKDLAVLNARLKKAHQPAIDLSQGRQGV